MGIAMIDERLRENLQIVNFWMFLGNARTGVKNWVYLYMHHGSILNAYLWYYICQQYRFSSGFEEAGDEEVNTGFHGHLT